MKLYGLLFCGTVFSLTYFPAQDSELAKSITRGKEVYTDACMACHMAKGEGVKGTYPPLAGADYLLKTPEKAIASIKFGLKGKIIVNNVAYDSMMPNPNLENDEIADVMNYILNSWGNKSTKPMVTEKIVAAVKR